MEFDSKIISVWERKEKTVMITFKAFRELRQEYDIKDFSKIKKVLISQANIKI